MKKYITVSIMVLLFLGLVIAGNTFDRVNRDVNINEDAKQKLAEYNITSPEISDLICDEDYCEFEMYQINEVTFTEINFRTNYDIPEESFKEEDDSYESIVTANKTYSLGKHTIPYDRDLDKLEESLRVYIIEWLENYAEELKDRENYSRESRLGGGNINLR